MALAKSLSSLTGTQRIIRLCPREKEKKRGMEERKEEKEASVKFKEVTQSMHTESSKEVSEQCQPFNIKMFQIKNIHWIPCPFLYLVLF